MVICVFNEILISKKMKPAYYILIKVSLKLETNLMELAIISASL